MAHFGGFVAVIALIPLLRQHEDAGDRQSARAAEAAVLNHGNVLRLTPR